MRNVAVDLAHIRKVVKEAEEALGPVEHAGILPADTYTDANFWEFERQSIFAKEWLCVAHVNEVPRSGDYLPITVQGEPVVVVRDEAGTVRVLSAVCQHRGHPLVGGVKEMPPAGRCLNARALVCPYHAWTYNLDGKLRGAPSMEHVPLAELQARNSLPEIRSEIFHGLVFVTFSEDVAPVAEKLAKLDEEFRTYSLAELQPGRAYSLTDLQWNWKLHHENALESYHTSYVHRGYHDAVPAKLTRFYDLDPAEGMVFRTTGFEAADGDLFESEGTRRLPSIPTLTDEQKGRVMFVSVMPCLVMVMQPSLVSVTFLNPTSAGTLNSRRVNLYPKAAAEAPDFEQLETDQFDKMKTIVAQDAVTQIALQGAYHSRHKPRGRLSYLEGAIAQLNQWSVHRYRRQLDALEPHGGEKRASADLAA
ncbi:aromatic ring-hydroxylating oxygenase subunit alpha [Hydrogenophaga sp. BPS33]|uniref:aromatic ring-hydroxylating oxygenase subunit alpha n=1 Tax=Hydrogenophaga sp. BPS33 TaxID=2651974 RepID=UPI00131FC032|nr:aromatic ring-hydroxylating dioxygenase subunit alpha [Hydrogenophaga sp. BPS33]QHE83520.1 aromatic ring-hydroxylating dioxygenase subunit alpha [Hydrogenophaga sp. BPS33]